MWLGLSSPKGTSMLQEEGKCPQCPLCYIASPSLHLQPHRELSLISCQRKKRLECGEKKYFHWAEFQVIYLLCIALLGRRNEQIFNYILIHGLWPMVWLSHQEIRRNMNRNLVARKYEENVCGQTSLNSHKTWRYLCPMWMSTKGRPKQRRILRINWIRWHSLWIHQPLFSATSFLLMNNVAMGGRKEIMHGVSNMNFCSQWPL